MGSSRGGGRRGRGTSGEPREDLRVWRVLRHLLPLDPSPYSGFHKTKGLGSCVRGLVLGVG